MDYIAKHSSKVVFILYVATTSLALVVLKLSSSSGMPIDFTNGHMVLNINIYTICGILLYGLSFLLYTYLLSKFNLGYIIPLTTALVYVGVFIASFVIFNETFTLAKILGIGFILIGLTLLNGKK